MRVIAGAFKGRRLVTPRGERTRPTADQVRTALMDALGPWLDRARVLDLFAGAGGVGLEAVSRGAAHATFVEHGARALVALRQNIAALDLAGRCRVVAEDAVRALRRLGAEGQPFDIVFLDPPYASPLGPAVLEALGGGRLVRPGSIVVAQHLTKRPPPARVGRLQAYRARRFGETTLTFFRAGDYDAPSPAAQSTPEV